MNEFFVIYNTGRSITVVVSDDKHAIRLGTETAKPGECVIEVIRKY